MGGEGGGEMETCPGYGRWSQVWAEPLEILAAVVPQRS